MTSARARSAAEGPVAEGSAAEGPVSQVLVVHKTHLDVGFTDLAAAVRRRYLDEFFPRAIAVAAALRERGGRERFRWTTGSWVLTEALEAEARAGRTDVQRAVEAGDLCWHALPFTVHTEYCGRSLLEHGLAISAELDRRFGRRTRAAKMTDVPGHTRGLVSVLAAAGVDFLHIGVNPAAAVPEVPLQFRWRDLAAVAPVDGGAPEVNVMYQPGGYGDVQVVPGTGVAVAIDLTGDNLGPRGAEQVIERFAELRRAFPGADVRAASLDEVADVMRSASAGLPVVTAEIGDTWIHGVGSDPTKTSGFRELCRLRQRWIDADRAAGAVDPALAEASTNLLLVAEHTWGLDQKTHWPDESHWSAESLAALRRDPAAVRFETSWTEQREYLDRFSATLRRHGRSDRAAEADAAMQQLRPVVPSTDALSPLVDVSAPVRCGQFELRFAADGSIRSLIDAESRQLGAAAGVIGAAGAADVAGAIGAADVGLGQLRVQTYDAANFERWFATYNAATGAGDEWWARWDNTKPGLAGSGAVARVWVPRLTSVWTGSRDGYDLVLAHLDFPDATIGSTETAAPAALPARAVMIIRSPSNSTASNSTDRSLEFELLWFDKPAARWPEATWWGFAPVVRDPARWMMHKLDESVSPFDVVPGGAQHLHCADRVTHPEGVELEFVDTSLVAPGAPQLLVWDGSEPDLHAGWHQCLYDSIWGTNFPMWAPGDARFRVRIRFSTP